MSNRAGRALVAASSVNSSSSTRLESDAELKDAVEELFVHCQGRIGRYLVQMVGDRALAEDLLQDSFHDALRSRAQLPQVRNREAWLYGIARNRALRALRKRRRFDRVLSRLGGGPTTSGDGAEIIAVRDLLVRTLSPEDRALVLLRYLHDFDTNELAEMSGLTVEAIWQRLSRARARLIRAARLHDTNEGEQR
jgi:RNA polymerase sigma-70 factor, ECF subfamily